VKKLPQISNKSLWRACFAALLLAGCKSQGPPDNDGPDIPRGYRSTVQIHVDGRRLSFGPFVGYYFRPDDPHDLGVLRFVCFNERSFYTTSVAPDTLLYEGKAIQKTLPEAGYGIPHQARINPVFFEDAPAAWRQTRPAPSNAYVHFHSCYSGRGAARTGYWLSHRALTNFVYDMGGRTGLESPLYHVVSKGVDTGFARIIEFDHGPTHTD
jgi:hypothetical protein